jgi:hypothetical protein
MIWLWRDTSDPVRMAAHAEATFWYVLPSLPMFLLIPLMLRSGWGFWPSLVAGCLLTMALYAAMIALGPKLGLRLSPGFPKVFGSSEIRSVRRFARVRTGPRPERAPAAGGSRQKADGRMVQPAHL